MMFLINASNLKNGGGLQVACSICEQLRQFPQHRFIVVLSEFINDKSITYASNTEVHRYNVKHDLRTILTGRDYFLDKMVEQKKVKAVLTIFGPSIWRPQVPHLCGFARAQLLLKDSPFYQHLPIKERVVYKIWAWAFRKCSNVFYTENQYISDMLPNLIKGAKVYTVSNYYNQVFDHPEKWHRSITINSNYNDKSIVTLLTVSSTASHKNLGIMVPIAKYLEQIHPNFNFRFVLTSKAAPFKLPEHLQNHFVFIGKVDVSECPYLYEQADIMFMPTLMECFTATYPEAMRMEVPIVTTDLEFARVLCCDAACYYSAVDVAAAAEAIYKVATDKEYAHQLIINGKKQLTKFDNYEQRAEKLIWILEKMAS